MCDLLLWVHTQLYTRVTLWERIMYKYLIWIQVRPRVCTIVWFVVMSPHTIVHKGDVIIGSLRTINYWKIKSTDYCKSKGFDYCKIKRCWLDDPWDQLLFQVSRFLLLFQVSRVQVSIGSFKGSVIIGKLRTINYCKIKSSDYCKSKGFDYCKFKRCGLDDIWNQ